MKNIYFSDICDDKKYIIARHDIQLGKQYLNRRNTRRKESKYEVCIVVARERQTRKKTQEIFHRLYYFYVITY
jgi:hypothetical protein